ncbi:MAG: hypothetical protein AB7F86_20120 [Bdellovibrionales bacterium]
MQVLKWMMVSSLLFAAAVSWAEDEDSYTNYDSIVADLRAAAETPAPVQDDFSWDKVAIQGGLGFATSYVHVQTDEGFTGSGLMKGISAHLGLNLFTPKARAEIEFRRFGQESMSSNFSGDLKEFELRVVFLPVLQDKMTLRMGTGISARYMNIDTRVDSKWRSHRQSTPSSSLMMGLERKVTKTVSVGPDITYRSALISDTFDKRAWDAALRLNATF